MRRFSPILALALTGLLAGVAFGHHVTSVSGTVDCAGNTSVTVVGDIFGTTHLIVKVNGGVNFDGVTGQVSNSADTTYGPFLGTGGTPGMPISATTNEAGAFVATGNLVLIQEVCPTPTPSPSPSASPSASPSPTVAPSATPVATPVVTPSETPTATATIPNTAMELPNVGSPVLMFLGILFIGLAVMLIANAAFRKR